MAADKRCPETGRQGRAKGISLVRNKLHTAGAQFVGVRP